MHWCTALEEQRWNSPLQKNPSGRAWAGVRTFAFTEVQVGNPKPFPEVTIITLPVDASFSNREWFLNEPPSTGRNLADDLRHRGKKRFLWACSDFIPMLTTYMKFASWRHSPVICRLWGYVDDDDDGDDIDVLVEDGNPSEFARLVHDTTIRLDLSFPPTAWHTPMIGRKLESSKNGKWTWREIAHCKTIHWNRWMCTYMVLTRIRNKQQQHCHGGAGIVSGDIGNCVAGRYSWYAGDNKQHSSRKNTATTVSFDFYASSLEMSSEPLALLNIFWAASGSSTCQGKFPPNHCIDSRDSGDRFEEMVSFAPTSWANP